MSDQTPPLTVLAVDNNLTNLYLIRSILEPIGYRVITVDSVDEALAALQEIAPDLIISDLHMPGKDGNDLLKAVKADPSLAGIPFIISSATRATRRERDQSIGLGASRFISTPLEPEMLLNVIHHCLKQGGHTMPTILAVEDDEIASRLLKAVLIPNHYALLLATNVQQAFELARTTAPDVAIVDYRLPGEDGFDFIRRLRADPALADTPVIVFTAISIDHTFREQANALDVVHILPKPQDPQAILDAVAACLASGEG